MSTTAAHDLAIAGLVPLSTVDWPGHLVATVFLQGCPWACGYCQNVDIIDPTTPGVMPWQHVLDLLGRRVGLLDGVVFTGGEALRQKELGSAVAQVRDRGFRVGLHTAGPYPRRLASLIGTLDWVGLDIKARREDYESVVGYDVGQKAWDSLEVVLASGVDHEVRTTVHPGAPAAVHLPEILSQLRRKGVHTFALQEARTQGTAGTFSSTALAWDETVWQQEFDRLVSLVHEAGFTQVHIRRA